jgi:hypothetical protein
MNKKLGLVLTIAGMAVQAVACWALAFGQVVDRASIGRTQVWCSVGLLPLLAGLALVAQAKRRSAAWALFGFLGIIGGIVVLMLPKVSDGDTGPAPIL